MDLPDGLVNSNSVLGAFLIGLVCAFGAGKEFVSERAYIAGIVALVGFSAAILVGASGIEMLVQGYVAPISPEQLAESNQAARPKAWLVVLLLQIWPFYLLLMSGLWLIPSAIVIGKFLRFAWRSATTNRPEYRSGVTWDMGRRQIDRQMEVFFGKADSSPTTITSDQHDR